MHSYSHITRPLVAKAFVSLLQIGEDPEAKNEAGIYLHILWRDDEAGTNKFWLYVGQACVLSERIRTHNDPTHRRRNMGLHYAVWGSDPGMKSRFVTVATFAITPSPQTQLILNLAEMWMCLIFQTLTAHHLSFWLPKTASALWSGNHLNVALPLWQGYTDTAENSAIKNAVGGRLTFQQYLLSEDAVIRTWAEDTRDAFNDTRNSPDPGIRKYWWNLHSSNIRRSQKTLQAKKAARAKEHLARKEATVGVWKVRDPKLEGYYTDVRAGS